MGEIGQAETKELKGIEKWFRTSSNGHWHSDEYYTRREDVDDQLNLYDLKNKKIYCPCDSDESAFVQYCIDNDLDYKNTSDDYYKHADLYEWCDIIITNPPFKNNSKWLRWLYKEYPDKEFILVQPLFSIKNRFQAEKFKKREWFIDGMLDRFDTPDGEKRVAVVWMSNVKNKGV